MCVKDVRRESNLEPQTGRIKVHHQPHFFSITSDCTNVALQQSAGMQRKGSDSLDVTKEAMSG
jgi:hypothetical protein